MVGLRCLCALLLITGLQAAVDIEAVLPWDDAEGYAPVVLTVRASAAAVIDLRVERDRGLAASDRLTVPPGISRHTLLVPTHQEGRFGMRLIWSADSGEHASIWLNPVIGDLAERAAVVGATPQRRAALVAAGLGELEPVAPEALPHRWQGLPWRMTVVLDAAALPRLDERQRQALRRFVATGGLVYALGGPWPGLPGVPGLAVDDAAALTQAGSAITARRRANHPVTTTRVHAAGTGGPILFMILAVVFGILAGPVNLMWVRRRGRLGLLLLTTPLLSLVACILLLVGGLLSEGISSMRQVIALVDLHAPGSEAVSWHGISYYAPFAPGTVAVDPEARATVLLPQTYQSRHHGYHRYRDRDERSDGLSIDWEGGQTLRGRWIPARQHRQLAFALPHPERRRLELRRQGDAWLVTNGLGVDIRALTWRDGDGTPHHIVDLPAGGEGTLQRGGWPSSFHASLNHKSMQCLEPAARQRWQLRQNQAAAFIAILATPLDPPPGPPAQDSVDPILYASGPLSPDAAPEDGP